MEEKKLKLSPPWVTYANELKELFGKDPDIHFEYDEDTYTVSLFVDNDQKAEAMGQLIPASKAFGNVELKINIVPANPANGYSGVLKTAFAGNPAVKDIVDMETPFGTLCYVVFRKEVVQFFNDQMDDLYGNRSTLYQEIARDILGDATGASVCFCTATAE